MTNQDLFDRLIRLLKQFQENHSLESLHDAFILWFAQYHLALDPDEVAERIVQDRHAEGVDALLVDHHKRILYFLQAKTTSKAAQMEKNLPETELKTMLAGVQFLLQGDYRSKITPELEDLVDEYHTLDKTGDYKTKVLFAHWKANPVDLKFVDAFKSQHDPIEVEILGISRIAEIYTTEYLPFRNPPPDKVTFELSNAPHRHGSDYSSLVFTIKGKELAKTYGEHKESIFQQNVRNPIGLTGAINKGIYETAIDDEKAKRFWYFNNGIYIVCKNFALAKSEKNITLKSPQIINGAQTTHAIFQAYNDGLLSDAVELLVKAVQVADQHFIEDVTLYSNAQNAIRLRDLSANDEIQERLKKIVYDHYGYYYQKKRGEFETEYPTKEEQKKIFGKQPRSKLIDNEKSAMAYLSIFETNPVAAKKDKWMIFLKGEGGYYSQIFRMSDQALADKLVYSWLLLRYVEEKKKEYTKIYRAEKSKESPDKSIISDFFLKHSDYFLVALLHKSLVSKQKDLTPAQIAEKIRTIREKRDSLESHYIKAVKALRSTIFQKQNSEDFYTIGFFKDPTAFRDTLSSLFENGA